jgi:dolichyl-phosphate beta-glucosyltransferase
MVVGARELPELSDRSPMSRVRRTGGRVFSAIANSLLKIDIKDTQCGFKGFTAHTARKIFTKSTVDGYAFDVEIFVLARRFSLSIEKMPVTLVRNEHSKVRLIRDPFLMLTDLLRLYSKQKQEL